MSDNIITAIFKQHWQKQYVPGLSTAAESIVDSEMLILLVYFLLMFIFSPYSCVWEYLLLKHNIVFFILEKEIKSVFFLSFGERHNPLLWKLSLTPSIILRLDKGPFYCVSNT